MTIDHKGFTNQFVLCKHERHIPEAWEQEEFGGWLLGFHPTLPVTSIQSPASVGLGWLLGYPIDEDGNMLKEVTVCDQDLQDDDLSRFESWLGTLGGTFAAILISPRASRFYLDAGGTLPAVYHADSEVVASTTSLIRSAEENEALKKIMGIPELDNWYPFGLTPKKSVERLIPNHYLDLATWNIHRHWPTEGTITFNHDIASAVQGIAEVLERGIEGVTTQHHTYMSLTAGHDTRILLACARDLLDNLTFYTCRTPDKWGVLDCTIASEIARRFNLKHIVINHQEATEKQRQDWLDRTGHCVGGRVYISFAADYQLAPSCPRISGKIGPTGGAHYYHRLNPTLHTEFRGEVVSGFLFNLPQTPEIVKRADAWLQGLSEYDILTVLDLIKIEQRAGCWASPQQYGNNWNIFQIMPFCHRKVFELLLNLPPNYRIRQEFSRDLLNARWPELLEFPFNNYRGVRGLKKNVRRHPVFRGLRKAVKNLRA